MKRKKRFASLAIACWISLISMLLAYHCAAISFNGIPLAFGDLDLEKRTDIVVVGDDGTRLDIYFQRQHQNQPLLKLGYQCKSDKPIIQVYLADTDSNGRPNLLPLIFENGLYRLKSLQVQISEDPPIYPTKLNQNVAYSLALTSNNSSLEPSPLKRDIPSCLFVDLNVEMKAQPLLFDLNGDLRTDLLSLDKDYKVSVWELRNVSDKFVKVTEQFWSNISEHYFADPHSNAFIDINNDNIADLVFSTGGKIAYLYANKESYFDYKNMKEFDIVGDNSHTFGQSVYVDINADGNIDHIIPRCNKATKVCDVMALFPNGHKEVIFEFKNVTENSNYFLEQQIISEHYIFPITLRASDLDGDGYTDFVTVAKSVDKNVVLYLRNIPTPRSSKLDFVSGGRSLERTFELQEIKTDYGDQDIRFVTLFDINEDGKVDMLIGASSSVDKPENLNVTARLNTQMVDACFMKVLVTNGYHSEGNSGGQSARGPFICFQLTQNDGNKMEGCAGQLSQSSHFALQQPYVVFGLGQTPHFVETLNITIPGYGTDKVPRTRTLEQIVPDAQIIIIPRQRDNPSSWEYKMFLSPMSDLVFKTLIALVMLCLIILLIIFILHRQEALEDAAEHEEYKRHWPECR